MRKLLVCLAALVLLDCSPVQAQLFGRPRNVGRPLSRSPGPPVAEDVGIITGAERFLRNNRDRASFVGADQREAQNFVGSQQARTTGTIVSSTAGIEPPRNQSSQINRPLSIPRAGQMYLPKIVLDVGDVVKDPDVSSDNSVSARVQQAADLVAPAAISVSVVGRTAILSGVVRSDEERRLAETLASFEPGISSVRNLLQTQTSAPDQFQSLPAPH